MKQKFLLSSIAILSFATITNAQVKKGQSMLGGNISFSNSSTKAGSNSFTESETTSFNISPQFGIGVGKNWVIGLTGGYAYSKIKPDYSIPASKVNTYSIGVFGRKFHPFNDQFGIYGELTAEAGFGKVKITSSTAKEDLRTLSACAQPGFYFMPAKKIVLEATFGILGYTNTEHEYGNSYNKTKIDEFKFSVTDGLSIGLKVIL